MKFRLLTRTLIPVLLLSSQAFAQSTPAAPTPPPPQSDEQREARLDLERKAAALLEDAVKDSESFKHLENRIRVKAAAANILWPHDASRARALFKEAMTSLTDLLGNQSAGDPAEAVKEYESSRQLRAEMLQMLAQRDARLAREFLRATHSPGPKAEDGAAAAAREFELQVDMGLAMQIASSDPALAAEIAQESMAKGFPYQLPNLVYAMREKDPEAAAKLAADIVSKLRADKLESSPQARHVAVSLLRTAAEVPEAGAAEGAKAQAPLLDQAALRELTEMIASEALRSSPHSAELLSSLESMMPVVEKYAPARAAALRRKMPQAGAAANEEGTVVASKEENEWEKYAPLLEKGSAEELLAATAKAQEPMRSALYQAAATKMIEKGDTEGARRLISEKITDPETRRQMLADIEKATAVSEVEAGNMEKAREALGALKTREDRVMALVQLAAAAMQKGQKKTALELLEEAAGMLGPRAKNVSQLGAQLMVARAYASLDPKRSLAILEPVVDQLNELLGAAIVLGGFFVEEVVKDDEVMLGPVMMFLRLSTNEFLSGYGGELRMLARADFGRTKALAERFQREEIRIMARLLLAQSLLSSEATPSAGAGNFIRLGMGGLPSDRRTGRVRARI